MPDRPFLFEQPRTNSGSIDSRKTWPNKVDEPSSATTNPTTSSQSRFSRLGPLKRPHPITTLFVDVGGVLLTNGWDHLARQRAARHFKLNWTEMDQRHRLVFETHEEGKLSFEEYLDWVVFSEKRPFTRKQFRDFMFAQSKPYPKMLGLVAQLKARHGLRVAVISNESREVNAYRIRTFKLDRLVDAFVSSCFVGMRKPDVAIFRLALDLAQTAPEHAVFIDNTPMFVQIAERLGMHSILHTDYESTRTKLHSLGLQSIDAT
jgi:putative hydrolase of the HAD superfamily